MFAKETYTTRRNSLKKSLGTGLLLFLGNEESGMNYEDNTYHFRQDSTFPLIPQHYSLTLFISA